MNAVYKNNRKIIGLSYLNQVDPTTLYIFLITPSVIYNHYDIPS